MGKLSVNKGKVGEREAKNILEAYGVPAERISQLEADGKRKGDLEVAEIWKASVKYEGSVPKYLYDALGNGEDMLLSRKISKEHRGYPWLITFDLEWFLKTFI